MSTLAICGSMRPIPSQTSQWKTAKEETDRISYLVCKIEQI
jgi:hypothetical protein